MLAEQVVCTECDKVFPREEIIEFEKSRVCSNCKPTFLQKMKEGASVNAEMIYGTFWIRFGAKLIDGIILYVFYMIVNVVISLFHDAPVLNLEDPGNLEDVFSGLIATASAGLLNIVVTLWFSGYFLSKYAATPGKMVLGLKVIMPDGSNVSFTRGSCRYLAEMLSSMILLIGYLMMLFDDEKRTLHDHICNTRVIKK